MTQTSTITVQLYDSPEPVNDFLNPSPATPGNLLGDLKLSGGTIKLDRTWSPYVQASLVVALPSPGLLDLLDPRQVSRRILLTVVQTGGHGAGTWKFDLGLRSRTVDWVAGTVTIGAASDEARMHDALMQKNVSYDDFDVRSWLIGSLLDVGSTALEWYNGGGALRPFSGITGTANATVSSPPGGPAVLQMVEGTTFWDNIEPVLQATGLRLWCDNARVWHLDKSDAVRTSEVDLSILDDLISATDTIDRDSGLYADQVVITYSWTDSSGNAHTAWDSAAVASGATLGVALTYNSPKPAGGAAARVVTQLQTRGRQLELRARANWSLRPDYVFTAFISDQLPVQRGYVSAVEYDLAADQMTVTTRDVVGGAEDSWVQQPKGKHWASVPAGVAWSTYDAGTDLWKAQPTGRSWQSIPTGTAWSEYTTT